MSRAVAMAIVFLSVGFQAGIGEHQTLPSLHLMPMPKSLELIPGRLSIDNSFRVAVTARRIREFRRQWIAAPTASEENRHSVSLTPVLDSSAAILEIHCMSAGKRSNP